MAKKRVHEIAKAQGVSSKDLLAALKAAGVEAKVAASSVEEADALKAIERQRFDVALVDLRLGGDSGLDVLGEILRRSPRTAVVIITAHGTIDTAVEAMRTSNTWSRPTRLKLFSSASTP